MTEDKETDPIKEIRETKETEIHKTEYIEMELPKIYYERIEQNDSSQWEKTTISVSDKTSEKALETFKKVKDEVEK